MEHILQFGISIDEEKIVQTAISKASNDICNKIYTMINGYTRGYEPKLDRMFREEIKRVIDEEKEEIVERAVDRLVVNMTKQKAVKEAIAKVVRENNE